MSTHPEPAEDRRRYVGMWIASLLLIVTFVVGLLAVPPQFGEIEAAAEPPTNMLFFGRFHPILVHVPVGVLIFLMVLELGCIRRSVETKYGDAALLALFIGAAGSVFAVLAGIMLSREGGYGSGSFTLHQALGIIGTAGVLLGLVLRLIGMASQNFGLIDGYRAVLFLSFGIMSVGAHFGANMVHGSKYLTQYAPPALRDQIVSAEKWMLSFVEEPKEEAPETAAVEPGPEATPAATGGAPLVFQDLILPIFEEKCTSCHNADKDKGDLRLDTYELAMKGGDTEGNIIPGDSEGSLSMFRIMLPLDDDEHMPPEGKDQMTDDEIALLRWWIDEGASNTMTLNDAEIPADALPAVERLAPDFEPGKTALRRESAPGLSRMAGAVKRGLVTAVASVALGAVAAEEGELSAEATKVVAAVEKAGASLLPVSAEDTQLRFTALNVAKQFKDDGLKVLAPVSSDVVSMDLARTQITDAGLAAVGKMTALKELRLDNTGITDAGLKHLAGLQELEYLNLYGTKVTDKGLGQLAALKKLTSLYLWQTGATKEGIAKLHAQLPQAYINIGWNEEENFKPVVAKVDPVAAKPAKAAAGAAPATASGSLVQALASRVVIYPDVIEPILAAKCTACHSEDKTKGKLMLHDFASIMKGGSEGDINVVPGKSAESLMILRSRLPIEDDEHMPPEDEEQLTEAELEVLAWWIDQGASETMTLAEAQRDATMDGHLAAVLGGGAVPVAASGGGLDPEIAAKADVYSHVIAPILAQKCISCHGEEKGKGKLRAHTFADLMRGGSEGDLNIIPGKSDESLFVQRILLPIEDDEHMPPEDEPQMTEEELALLKWWIDGGAKEQWSVAEAEKTPEIEALLADALKDGLPEVQVAEEAEAKLEVAPMTEAEKKQVADVTLKLQGLNATLMPLAQDTELLRLSVINAADQFGDKELALLKPIGKFVVWLDLARSQISDAGLATVAAMPNLQRLHLENTKVGDAGMAQLGGLEHLQYLNLYGTKVTDKSLAALEGVAGLQKLFVWQTGITRNAAKALEGKKPGLVVNVGLSEAEIAKLTAPPPAPKEEAKPAAKPATKPAPKPDAKPDSKPAAKPAAQPAKKPATTEKKPAAGNPPDKQPAAAQPKGKPAPQSPPPAKKPAPKKKAA